MARTVQESRVVLKGDSRTAAAGPCGSPVPQGPQRHADARNFLGICCTTRQPCFVRPVRSLPDGSLRGPTVSVMLLQRSSTTRAAGPKRRLTACANGA